jgi:hypothetical protein
MKQGGIWPFLRSSLNTVQKERLCAAQQGEGMAPILLVVDEVAQPLLAAEPGQADGALRQNDYNRWVLP